MPFVENLSDYLKQSGELSKDSSPFVFWSGYGLDNHNSGIYVHCHSLAKALADKGIVPLVFTNSKKGSALGETLMVPLDQRVLNETVVKILNSKLLWPYRVGRELDAALKAADLGMPAVLHGLSNIDIPFSRLRGDVKKVVTIHDVIPLLAPGGVAKKYYYQLRYLLPRVVQSADRIICVSSWGAKTLSRFYPKAQEKTVVIANGKPLLRTETVISPKKDNEKIEALYVARFEPYKNVEFLGRLLRQSSDWLKVVVVTDARGLAFFNEQYSDLIENSSLKVFTNLPKKRLDACYRSADVYLSPSFYEGFSLPAADAVSFSLPVVYTSGSGIDETLGTEVAFAQSPQLDIHQWQTSIREAHRCRFEPTFQQKQKQHYDEMFSWQDSAKAHKILYNELVNK